MQLHGASAAVPGPGAPKSDVGSVGPVLGFGFSWNQLEPVGDQVGFCEIRLVSGLVLPFASDFFVFF